MINDEELEVIVINFDDEQEEMAVIDKSMKSISSSFATTLFRAIQVSEREMSPV